MAESSQTTAIPKDIQKLSFENALAELETIVRDLEDGRGELEGAIKAFERGTLLKRHCAAKLKEAEARIEQILPGGADGNGAEGLSTAEFD